MLLSRTRVLVLSTLHRTGSVPYWLSWPQTRSAECAFHIPNPKPYSSMSAAAGTGGGAAIGPGLSNDEPRRTKVAVGQMTSTGDQEANFRTCNKLAQDARAAGCSMLFLPECFSFIGMSAPETVSKAQPLDGPLMKQYRDLARSHQLWLSLGGFQETGPDPSHLYNAHVVINAAGDIVAHYRKIHLFDVDVPNGPVLMESRSTAPGDQVVICDSPAGRLGVTVCYDLRFPELYQHLTWDLGAQVLLVPSAFTRITGEAHWEVLLRARAIECQAYVVAAAQTGKHNEKRESFGHALIVDPWGVVVGRLEDSLATGIAVAELDLDRLAAVRAKMPVAQHRRQGQAAYGIWKQLGMSK